MSRVLRRIGVAVLGLLLLADVLVTASLVVLVVGSLTGGPEDDPHGYGLVFGVVALLCVVPAGLALLGSLRRLVRAG